MDELLCEKTHVTKINKIHLKTKDAIEVGCNFNVLQYNMILHTSLQ